MVFIEDVGMAVYQEVAGKGGTLPSGRGEDSTSNYQANHVVAEVVNPKVPDAALVEVGNGQLGKFLNHRSF